MSKVESIGAFEAIETPADICQQISGLSDRGNILPLADDWFALMGRGLWPLKAAAHLHHLTGASERTCRAWASGTSEPPSRVLATLLRSDEGPRVLAWLMDGADALWWREHLRALRITAAEDKIDRS